MSEPIHPHARRTSARPAGAARWLVVSGAIHLSAFAALAAALVSDEAPAEPATHVAAAPTTAAPALTPDEPSPPSPPLELERPPCAEWDAPADTPTTDVFALEPLSEPPSRGDETAPDAIGRDLGALRPSWARRSDRAASAEHAAGAAAAALPSPAARPSPPAADGPSPGGESRPPRFSRVPPRPRYPEAARRRGWEGCVVVRVSVGAAGDVADAQVVESSGRATLDDAALEAARAWPLEPALDEGRPVAGTLDVPVRFRLDD